MPSVSEKQRKLMAAACHDKEFADKVGIDQETACHFFEADKRRQKRKSKGAKKK